MIDGGEIVVKPPELPNVNTNPLPQHDTDEVNMIGVGNHRNHQYLEKMGDLPQGSRSRPVKWDHPEDGYAIGHEIALIKVQVNQLAELIVHQHQVTQQLINQINQSPMASDPPKFISITREDQSRLQEQRRWVDKIAMKSRIRREFAIGRKFTTLNQSKEDILRMLVAQGEITEFLPPPDPRSKKYDSTRVCIFHSSVLGHATEDCWALSHKIQNLIEVGKLKVGNGLVTVEESIMKARRSTFSPGPVNPGDTIAIITYEEGTSAQPLTVPGLSGRVETKPIRLAVPKPIILTSIPQIHIVNLKRVPWKYADDKGTTSNCTAILRKDNPLYLPGPERKQSDKTAGKVPECKIVEFLNKMNYNEVKVVKQLHEAPARISILDLILASDDHRKILIQVLEEAHLPKTIDSGKIRHLISHILDSNVISLIDDDIPVEGTGHRKPLHITVISAGYMVGGVLIDGGSTLNICPQDTLMRMKINPKRIRSSHIMVRAFDGSRREKIEEIELPVEIGPYIFSISFQVLDITTGYNLLLGRPWIHMAGAVPSTLHQLLKYIINGNLVTVSAEPEYLEHSLNELPLINLSEGVELISF